MPSLSPPFGAAFAAWARRIRRRLGLRHALTGAAIGLALGAGATGARALGIGPARPLGAAFGLLGAAAGLGIAHRRRWPDGHVALYLDARLGSDETIATALELDRAGDEAPAPDARRLIVDRAASALATATPARVRPRVLRRAHAALPLAAAAIAYLSLAPLPPRTASAAPPPGGERVQLTDVKGLDKIEALAKADARDEAQRERLQRLAEDAKKLRERLRDGMEKREAQAEIARLKDAITAERLKFGDGEQREGLDAAASKLGQNRDLKKAEKALGDRDLVAFDDEMERLANRLEAANRERAHKTLEEAEAAANAAGAKDVAKELARQKELLEQRGKKADKLRELAKELGDALGKEGKQALDDWNGSGSRKDLQKLEESLERALGKMSDEDRKKLAENLKKRLSRMNERGELPPGPTREHLRELAEQLDTEEGQNQLEEELRRMASDAEAERQDKLDDAQDGAGEAEGLLGGKPLPIAREGQNGKGQGQGMPGDQSGDPQPGHSDDPPGEADHHGMTGVVEGGEVKTRAHAKMNAGQPMPGIVSGRSAGRAGDTANVQGAGALGEVGPGEVSGVERSDVPEEYREQVGRYFQPK